MPAPSIYSPQIANHPVSGKVAIEPNLFRDETEKQIIQLMTPQLPANTFGSFLRFDIPKRGIYTMLTLVWEGTITVANGGGATAIRKAFPYGLIQNIQVRAGGNPIHNGGGWLYRSIEEVMYHHHVQSVQLNPVATGNGAYTCRIEWEIPLCADQRTLAGCLFSESEASYFDVQVQMANMADLFDCTGGAVVSATGQFRTQLTTFEVVREKVNGEVLTILPDVTSIYQTQQVQQGVTTAARTNWTLPRVDGTMMRVYAYLQNGIAAGQDRVDPSTFNGHFWLYGLNITPRSYVPGYLLLDRNQKDYNGVLQYNVFAHDFVSEDGFRDAVEPSKMSEPQIGADLTGVTLNAGSSVTIAMETLARGTNFEAVLQH